MRENITSFSILLPKDSSPAINFAVEEFNGIMALCGLAPLAVVTEVKDNQKVISLGETELFKATGFVPDYNVGGGYNIKTADGNVFIYSLEPSGIINGVYAFCENVFGYRFYAKDEIRVEKRSEYFVPEFDLSEKPEFMGRRVDSFVLYHDPEYFVRLKQNGMRMPDEKFGEGTPWSVLNDQSLAFQLIPREQYKTEEYIKKGWWSEKGDQLCWTKALYDDEMFELLCANLIQNVKDEPTKKFYMLGQTDNSFYCTCPTCQRDYEKYGVSGVFLRLVNRLADRVKAYVDEYQGGREHYLVMFAYLQTEMPPVKIVDNKIMPIDETVIARDNVAIRFAPLRSGVLYPHFDTTVNQSAAAAFIGWQLCAKHYSIWDYGTDFSAYTVPYPDWDVIQKNLTFFKDIGAKDILTQVPAHTAGTEFYAMKLYMRSRLMWDLTLDYKALMHDFMDKYYGAAAPKMEEYLDALREHYSYLQENAAYTGTIYAPLMQAYVWPYPVLQKFEKIFTEAFALVAEKETGARRELLEKRLRTESLFYRLIKFDSYKNRFTYDEQLKNVQEFERDAKEAGFIAFSNGWKQGRGHLDELISQHYKRLREMKIAKELENADNNPLIEWKKRW